MRRTLGTCITAHVVSNLVLAVVAFGFHSYAFTGGRGA